MTVYDIPNIENCTIEPIGNPAFMYRLIANDGWYIHLNDDVEDTQNIWKGAVVIQATETDYAMVEIRAAEDLPEGYELLTDDNSETASIETETETE